MKSELKPCPFCGSYDVKLFYDECQNYHVECYGCNKTVSFHIADKSSRVKATEIYNRRPAPENKALTLEKLRQMDGEPVYIVAWPDWGHWELSIDAADYLEDRDPDFYGMKHDDPYGRFGLHMMGWLAYRAKPEEDADA